MIDMLILDLDGPLLNGIERHYGCYKQILEEHGYTPIPKEQYWEMKRSRVDRRKLLELSGALSLYDEYLALWLQRIETKEYLVLDRLQNGAAGILSGWKNLGIRLLLATMRNHGENLHWQLRRVGIQDLLDEILVVGTERGSAGKAALVRDKLRDMDVKSILWVGDTEVDVQAARACGVKVCALTCGLRTGEYLASLSPDFLERDLTSFAERFAEKLV